MVAAVAAGMLALVADAQPMGGMDTKCGGMDMPRQGMMQGGTKGGYGMGMMGGMMMGGCGMGMMGSKMMDDPEIQKMMSDEMTAHYKQMMQQRAEFQKSMHSKMMRHPKVIRSMLTDMLEDPQAFKKALADDPELKAKLKKLL